MAFWGLDGPKRSLMTLYGHSYWDSDAFQLAVNSTMGKGAQRKSPVSSVLSNTNNNSRSLDDYHLAVNSTMSKGALTQSPVASMLSDFPNPAVAREVRRHDRYVVDGLSFLNTIRGFTVGNATSPTAKPYTIVVLTMNRAVPYIAVLIAMLLRGQEPKAFRQLLDIHVVNVERRKGREKYHLFDAMERKLSQLISFHRWTDPYSENAHIEKDHEKWFDANQMLDYIRSLKLCQSSQSSWCIVLQDDALPVDNFVGNLQHYIDRQTYAVMHDDTHKKEVIELENIGMLKLFAAHNCGHGDNERNLLRTEYANKKYRADINMTMQQRFGYRLSNTPPCGAVAEAIPATALSKLISYLQNQDVGPVDELLEHLDRANGTNLTVLELSPSMVNHIGFVSERHRGNANRIIVSTDVRFSLTRGVDQTVITGKSGRTFSISGMKGIFDINNAAIAREIQRHDRYVVDSMVYWSRFDEEQAARYSSAKDRTTGAPISLVILAVNRYLPYLSILLGTLLRGHTPIDLAEFDLHVVNVDRRMWKSEHFSLLDDFRDKLGSFVTFHEWTSQYNATAGIEDPTEHYYADTRFDHIRALKLCQANGSEYCIVLEDDALPCVGFLHKFRQYVDVEEYQVGSKIISRDNVAVMKLYNAWNDPIFRTSLFQQKGIEQYPVDRALDIYEAKARGQEVGVIEHRISMSMRKYGIIAEAYHSSVVPRLLAYLEEAGTGTFPVDGLINKFFIEDSGLERLTVDPSMVNHIGYMSEHFNDAQINTKRISTDVRFQLDDQSYWKKKQATLVAVS